MLTLNEITANLQQLFAMQEYATAAQIIQAARQIPDFQKDVTKV